MKLSLPKVIQLCQLNHEVCSHAMIALTTPPTSLGNAANFLSPQSLQISLDAAESVIEMRE
jgi:hypothetical protein